MRVALLDVKVGTSINSKFTAVNMRNMLLLQKELNADFYYSTEQISNNNKQYDVFIFGFGSINSDINNVVAFCKKSKNAKLFFLSGEYEQQVSQPLFYLKERYSVIKNYECNGNLAKLNMIISMFNLNLNLLISKPQNEIISKKYDCVYYGRWREDRAEYFKKYIQGGLYLSTSIKNMKKFKHEGCDPKYLNTISWANKKETLNLFRYSLYIEDKFTHKCFNNLANRWYEAGFCNVVVFFDVNCWNTINKSEIGQFAEQVKDYIVTDYNSLKKKIDYCNEDFEKHLAIQKSWRLGEPLLREQMINEFKRIITSN